MSDKPRGRAYSKRQRNWRRGEDSSRDKEAPKPTSILSKPKTEDSTTSGNNNNNNNNNPEFPTLLQANAASVKKQGSPLPEAPPPESPRREERPVPAPEVKVKKDPLESLEFPRVPQDSLRLVDSRVGFRETGGISEYLSDSNTDFLVVGIIGSKGSGKSCLLNGLIGSNVFRENDYHNELRVEDCTQGIHAWINSERVIFLDSQPALNGSFIKDRLSSSSGGQAGGKFFSLLNCYLKKESLGEKESLLLTLFLMNICHCLIFVQDYVLDPEVLHFLQLAEMLKPSSPCLDAADNNRHEYYPSLILAHNKLRPGEITPQFFQTLSEFYETVFAQSAFNVYNGISAKSHSLFRSEVPHLPEEESYAEFSLPPDLLKQKRAAKEDPPQLLNLFALNDRNHSGEMFKDLMDTFARRLLSIRRPRPLTTKTLTEKTWFSFAAQTWQSTCSAITSFNYELNIAAGGGPLSGSPTRSLEPLE